MAPFLLGLPGRVGQAQAPWCRVGGALSCLMSALEEPMCCLWRWRGAQGCLFSEAMTALSRPCSREFRSLSHTLAPRPSSSLSFCSVCLRTLHVVTSTWALCDRF